MKIKTFDDLKYLFENYNFNFIKYYDGIIKITFINNIVVVVLKTKIKNTNIRMNKTIKNYIMNKLDNKEIKYNYNLILPADPSIIEEFNIRDILKVNISLDKKEIKFNNFSFIKENYNKNYISIIQNMNNTTNSVSFFEGYYYERYLKHYNNLFKEVFKTVLTNITNINNINIVYDKNIIINFSLNGIRYSISNKYYVKKLLKFLSKNNINTLLNLL